MMLSDYLRENNLTLAEFAERVSVVHTTVMRWANGTLFPSAAAMRRIHAATDGQVTANDLLAAQQEANAA